MVLEGDWKGLFTVKRWIYHAYIENLQQCGSACHNPNHALYLTLTCVKVSRKPHSEIEFFQFFTHLGKLILDSFKFYCNVFLYWCFFSHFPELSQMMTWPTLSVPSRLC